jgi:hypothetical protein
MLDKQGNSTLENQQFVLTPVFAALSDYNSIVLGDREFCNTLANWIREKKVGFWRATQKECLYQDGTT